MKSIIRKIFGLLIAIPFIVMEKVLSLFIDRQKVIGFLGPIATFVAKIMGKIFIIPRVKDSSEFDKFISRMKIKIWLMKPFYDISVAY